MTQNTVTIRVYYTGEVQIFSKNVKIQQLVGDEFIRFFAQKGDNMSCSTVKDSQLGTGDSIVPEMKVDHIRLCNLSGVIMNKFRYQMTVNDKLNRQDRELQFVG